MYRICYYWTRRLGLFGRTLPLEMLLCRCRLNIATGREVRNVITQPISCDKLSELRHRVASTNFTAASGPTTGSACKVRLAASSPVPRPYRERFIDDIIKQNYYYDRLSKLNIIRWSGARSRRSPDTIPRLLTAGYRG